jgi:hypothetical protein
MNTAIERDQQHCCGNCGETPCTKAPTLPNDTTNVNHPTLLLSVYPAPPKGPDSFHRWPTPLKQLRIGSDENITAHLLGLLHEGGPGSYVQVEILA